MNAVDSRPGPNWKKIAVFAVMALAGAVVGAGAAMAAEINQLAWADELALIVAAALLATAAISVWVLVRRPASVPKGCGILQITVTALAGVMLLLPIFGPGLLPGGIDPLVIYGAIVVLFAVQTVANLMLMRRADELLRNVTLEAGALAFWVLQGALFLYAAAERLGLVATLSNWGLVAILMTAYLMASIVIQVRRGLATDID